MFHILTYLYVYQAFCYCTVRRSISIPANENTSRYQRFMDSTPMNRYYYRLVNKSSERVNSVCNLEQWVIIFIDLEP